MSKNESPNKQSRRETTTRRTLAVLLAAALAASTAFVASAFSRTATRAVAATTLQGDELRVELSTAGFDPAQVTHAAGAFAIAVDNLDVTEEYVLQLKTQAGALLKEVRVQQGSAEWTVELGAASYTLTVAGHPDWVCQIVVQ